MAQLDLTIFCSFLFFLVCFVELYVYFSSNIHFFKIYVQLEHYFLLFLQRFVALKTITFLNFSNVLDNFEISFLNFISNLNSKMKLLIREFVLDSFYFL